MKNSIATIPKQVSGGEELVVLPRRSFDVFQKWQQEIEDALGKVRRGRQEYRARKTIVTLSPRRFQ